MNKPVRIAVAGVGLIGQSHCKAIVESGAAEIDSVIDPSDSAVEIAKTFQVDRHRSLREALESGKPEGIIIATPNRLHVPIGVECLSAGLPMLIEKPIADSAADARGLVEKAEHAGIPIAVGHHRRHNPIIAKAKAKLDAGLIGRIVAVQGTTWLMKPETYFKAAWRKEQGGGPVLINLIHDVDLLRHLCGEVQSVQAADASEIRGHSVEDTAAIILRFESGALGTLSVSDTVSAPWSWELTSAENPVYSATDEACYLIGGTAGALSLPGLHHWRFSEKPHWWSPIEATPIEVDRAGPLVQQIRQFADVIRNGAAPLVSGREGLKTLCVIEAIKAAAQSQGLVTVSY